MAVPYAVIRWRARTALFLGSMLLTSALAACTPDGGPRDVVVDESQAAGALTSPELPEGAEVLAESAGRGATREPSSFNSDGSYALLATCANGEMVTVSTTAGDGATVEVPCTGYTSRMRFVMDESEQAWTVDAQADQEWSIAWVNWDQE